MTEQGTGKSAKCSEQHLVHIHLTWPNTPDRKMCKSSGQTVLQQVSPPFYRQSSNLREVEVLIPQPLKVLSTLNSRDSNTPMTLPPVNEASCTTDCPNLCPGLLLPGSSHPSRLSACISADWNWWIAYSSNSNVYQTSNLFIYLFI